MILYDQTSDLNGQQLYNFSKLYNFPKFVKQASSDDIFGTDNLSQQQFADPYNRQFPCHTAAATYISNIFFFTKEAEVDKTLSRVIKERLDNFSKFHGIENNIETLREKIASYSNIEDDLSDYAVVIPASQSSSGQIEKHFPLRNSQEVYKAAEYLHKFADQIPFDYRTKIATAILLKADEFGTALSAYDDFLQKQAGLGTCSAYDAATMLFQRAKLLKLANKSDYAIQVAKMARAVAQNPATVQDESTRLKIASLINEVDYECKLDRLFDDLIKPEDILFNITEKKAADFRNQHLTTTSGNIYNIDDLNSLRLSQVRDVMGDDFASAVAAGGLLVSPTKLAEIVPTLPRGDAELFDTLLSSLGIKPIAKEAAHNNDSLDYSDYKLIAEHYKLI